MWWIILIIIVIVGFILFKNMKLQKTENSNEFDMPSRSPFKTNPIAYVNLQPNNEYDFEIVGEASYQNNLASIAGPKASQSKELYLEAIIEAEPNNQYDKNAIRVSIDNKIVGYFDRETAKEFKREYQRKGFSDKTTFKANAVVVGGWKDKNSQGSYGVKLDIDSDNFGL